MSSFSALVSKCDVHCFYILNQKYHTKFLNITMKYITHIGSTLFSIAITAFLMVLDFKIGKTLFLNLVFCQLIIQTLKRVVNRPRPYIKHTWTYLINPPKCKYSFPSGHTNSAFVIAIVLSYFIPFLAFIFLSLALMVGFSRIYLGCHYPTDVFIGFIISVLGFVTYIKFNFIQNLLCFF